MMSNTVPVYTVSFALLSTQVKGLMHILPMCVTYVKLVGLKHVDGHKVIAKPPNITK